MKKVLLCIISSVFIISCNQEKNDKNQVSTPNKEFKTAYIDVVELMKENLESKDINSKHENLIKSKGADFEKKVAQFKAEVQALEANAKSNGMEWAQRKSQELQRREQELAQLEQRIMSEARQAHAVESDSLTSRIKKYIKEYGKKNNYSYIYGTGEANSVLYAEESFDITNEMIDLLNEQYKPGSSKDRKEKKEEKQEEKTNK
jgi:outer membrane protein